VAINRFWFVVEEAELPRETQEDLIQLKMEKMLQHTMFRTGPLERDTAEAGHLQVPVGRTVTEEVHTTEVPVVEVSMETVPRVIMEVIREDRL